jgi:hypothetical protein
VIVNVIGVAGERPRSNYIAGTSGNAALIAFTRALGAERDASVGIPEVAENAREGDWSFVGKRGSVSRKLAGGRG